MKIAKQKPGTALILTLLVIGVLSVVGFGLGQVFVTQVRITTSFEDTQGAFYVAQAGLEEGLRRFGQNRNFEGNFAENFTVGAYQASLSYKRVNPSFGPVEKDETFEIDTTGLSQLRVTVNFSPITGQSFLQVGRINAVDTSFDQSVFPITQPTQTVSVPLNNTARVRIKPLGGRISQMSFDTAGVPVDSGTTTITSTGTFGRVKRKLEAKIDRQSGTLTGIFDYALLSQLTIQ